MPKIKNWDLETDVIVVGSGGVGLTAAICSHDQGAQDGNYRADG